jgi:hypothetical protein
MWARWEAALSWPDCMSSAFSTSPISGSANGAASGGPSASAAPAPPLLPRERTRTPRPFARKTGPPAPGTIGQIRQRRRGIHPERTGRRHEAGARTDRPRFERPAIQRPPRAEEIQGKGPPREPAPADEGAVIPGPEVAAATTADILGKGRRGRNPLPRKPSNPGPRNRRPRPSRRPGARRGLPGRRRRGRRLRPPPRPNQTRPRKPKPIAVAATPKIGNYSCRRWISSKAPTPPSSRPRPRRS